MVSSVVIISRGGKKLSTNLKIYRLEDSLWGSLFRIFRKPDMPAGAQVLGSPLRTLQDFVKDKNIYLLDKDQINKFINAHNESWNDDVYYIRHPKQYMDRYLIKADTFLQYIEQQQLAEIIAYVRNNCNPHRIFIETSNTSGFKGGVNGRIQWKAQPASDSNNTGSINIGTNASLRQHSYNRIEIICTNRIKPSEQVKNFVWIDDFSVLKTAIDNYGNEKISIDQEIIRGWYISAKLASFIGLDNGTAKGSIGSSISSESKYNFHITIE